MENAKKVGIVSFGILSDDEIRGFTKTFQHRGVEVEIDNSTSHTTAMLTVEDVTNLAKVIFTPDVAKDLAMNVAGGALFEALRRVTRKIWKFSTKHRINKTTSTTINDEPVDFKTLTNKRLKELSKKGSYLKFGWEVIIRKGLRVAFRIDPHATSQQLDAMLDSFRDEQLPKWLRSKRQGDFWLMYNYATGKWRFLDRQKVIAREMNEIRKRVFAKSRK